MLNSWMYVCFFGGQVARGDFIVFFNEIFDALCKLSADSDPNVQSAAHLLDRLVKVITFPGSWKSTLICWISKRGELEL